MPPLDCPSSRCEEGAALIGLVTTTGSIAFVGKPIRVTSEIRKALLQASAGRPEQKYRFTRTCIASRCENWSQESESCDIGSMVAESAHALELTVHAYKPLPECGIRSSCRWYSQEGPAVCIPCTALVS